MEAFDYVVVLDLNHILFSATVSYAFLATDSNAEAPGPVTLVTIHEDIQLLHFTILFIFTFMFVLFLNRRAR